MTARKTKREKRREGERDKEREKRREREREEKIGLGEEGGRSAYSERLSWL